MTVTRVRRLVNPTRTRRKLSDKQIRHFGTKAQRAALKRRRSTARATTRPVRRTKARAATRRRRAVSNPATLLTIGALNPQPKRRRKTMATKTRKRRRSTARAASTTRRRRRAVVANPRRRRATNGRKRRNGTKIYVMRRNRGRGRARNGMRRNPEVFGLTGVNMGKAILSGLVGVYATKTITPMVASAVPQLGSSSIMGAIISGIVAWGGGMLVAKWDRTAGAGFFFGGLMQAGSQLLNLVVTPNPLSLSGLGDFAPASFPVPQNPIRAAAMQRALMSASPAGQSANLSGVPAAAQFV